MKKLLPSIIVLLVFAFSQLSAKAVDKQIQNQSKQANQVGSTFQSEKFQLNSPNNMLDEFKGGLIWLEDFENMETWDDWKSIDLFVVDERGPSEWLVDSWEAIGDSSWRCADTSLGDNGGYADHWYQVLDTPPILLNDTSAMLTFYHRYSVEGAAGSEAPYDAWDGMNVRISTDGGDSWMVLASDSYGASSIWAFGHPVQGHNEGPGVPGWVGDQLTWTKEMFDLKPYVSAEDSVMLRFAFASDNGFSTADGAPALFGWQIDSIEVSSPSMTFFENYGTTEDLMGSSQEYILQSGGDLWQIAEVPALQAYTLESIPSPTHAAVCQNGDGFSTDSTYNPLMDNVFEYGPITLPADLPVIYFDYKALPNFFDNDEFPAVDYIRTEIRLATDTTDTAWVGMEDPAYVYSTGANAWFLTSWAYGMPENQSMFNLTPWAGENVYVRVRFWSDEDSTQGVGLMVDDLVIYSPINPPEAPENLVAMPSPEDTSIVLTWDYADTVSYTVWRSGPGDDGFFSIAGGITDSAKYIDKDIEPYKEYYYLITAGIQYSGRSGASNLAATTVFPANIVEVAYDNGMSDNGLMVDANKMLVVKFAPEAYPVGVKTFSIYIEPKDMVGTAGKLALFDEDEYGFPNEELLFNYHTGLAEGFNVLEFDTTTTIDSGSFFIGYQRFSSSPYIGVDSTSEVANRTMVQDTDTTWMTIGANAIIHAYIDTSNWQPGTSIDDHLEALAKTFVLGKNYPNPFNPETTIPFIVPSNAAGQELELSVFNVLGQKVVTLFKGKAAAGLNNIQWDGKNKTGRAVSSGLYFYRLKAKDVVMTQRMLLIK